MTARDPRAPAPEATGPVTLVWVDSREAIVIRWDRGATTIDRIESDVPVHRRATGHEAHHPDVRYGAGTGHPHTTSDPRRLEHLARFLDDVMTRLPAGDDLILIGPGTVHEHLAGRVAELDARHHHHRSVRSEAAPRLTRSQLMARLRRAAGDEPRRHTMGAYRWTSADGSPAAGTPMPRRVTEKRPSHRASLDMDTG